MPGCLVPYDQGNLGTDILPYLIYFGNPVTSKWWASGREALGDELRWVGIGERIPPYPAFTYLPPQKASRRTYLITKVTYCTLRQVPDILVVCGATGRGQIRRAG
jgi:hypothetical protein